MRNTGLSVIALVCAIAGVDVSADNVGMQSAKQEINNMAVSYTHLRAHET